MPHSDYKSLWNSKSGDAMSAMIAVDGSANEAVTRATGEFSARQVRAALALGPQDAVFEIGCGVGRIGHEIAGEIAAWHGLDISENMLAVASERLGGHANVHLHALHASNLAVLADNSVDKGYCVAVFIHMDKEDFVLYLRDVLRALKPGGLFYFDHWNLKNDVGWRRFLLEVDTASHAGTAGRKDVGRNQFCTPEEIRVYADALGFEQVSLISDTPWVQAVLRKPDGDASRLEAERRRCELAAGDISYGQDWTHYFDLFLQSERNNVAPTGMLEATWRKPAGDKTVSMFRHWVHGIWPQGAAAWGVMPEALKDEFG